MQLFSADTWVPGPACSNINCPSTKFDIGKSSTFKQLSFNNFNITYAIGEATGAYAIDTISIGGASVINQQFGLASNSSSILELNTSSSDPNHMNGILGLGYSALQSSVMQGNGEYVPLISNMYNQGVIDSPIFSVYLNSTSQYGWSGEITFGGTDSSKYQGDINYLPVYRIENGQGIRDGYYYWMTFGFDFGLTVPSGTFIHAQFISAVYILDTGSTLSYLPDDLVEQIVANVTGTTDLNFDAESGAYIVDCKTNSSSVFFLTFTDSFNAKKSVRLNIPISELLIPTGTTQNGTELCAFGIAPANTTSDMYVIGDSILRSLYMVFDMKENRIGLAVSKGSESKITSGAAHTNKTVSFSAVVFASLFVTLYLFL